MSLKKAISRKIKALSKTDQGHNFLACLISGYIRFVYYTTKWDYIGFDEQEKFAKNNKTGIVIQWHNRIAMVAFGWDVKKYPAAVLVSGHSDGKFVSKAMESLGLQAIEGSSSQGGVRALMKCIKAMRNGTFIAMTPDGPRGPRMRMKESPVMIAKKTDAPISIRTCSVKRRIVLNSWDRFILPLPFNKGVFLWKELKKPAKHMSEQEIEDYRLYLEYEMNEAAALVDRKMGHSPIEAADPNEKPKQKRKK